MAGLFEYLDPVYGWPLIEKERRAKLTLAERKREDRQDNLQAGLIIGGVLALIVLPWAIGTAYIVRSIVYRNK